MKRTDNWLLTLLLIISFVTTQAQSNYEVASDANFRKGPGTGFKSIEIIKAGERVYVFDITNPNWFKVEYNGKLGYMSSKLLSRIIAPPVTIAPPATVETELEKSSDGIIWSIGITLVIALLVFSIKNRKKIENSTSTAQQVSKTHPIQTLTKLPLNESGKDQIKPAPVINNLKKDTDPSIIDINEFDYNIKISVEVGSGHRSKESSKSDQSKDIFSISTYYADNVSDENYWGLGTKYKARLNLTEDQVDILNKPWTGNSNFCSIEFFCVEVVKLFIASIKSLNENFIKENSTLNQKIATIVDIVLRKHFRYQLNSFNYKSSIESTTSEIYTNIFKHCENTVRNHYGHKRKLSTDCYFASTTSVQIEYEELIITSLNKVLLTLISTIAIPDEDTEIALNEQNTSRWKDKFEEIFETYKEKPQAFLQKVLKLGELNIKNPSVENIFFEASKFIAKENKEIALTLYTHYLYHDLKSANFDNKQLTKTIQKNIFQTNDQLKAFKIIISNLIQDKNLEKALQGIPGIFTSKRKKIKLDTVSIKEVQLQHSGTVELLNEYLKDEYEDENKLIRTQETSEEEITIQITPKSDANPKSIYKNNIHFSPIHIDVLEVFTKSNFSVISKELETIIKSKGYFANQVIENINELTYEYLDDILIEEEDDCLTINPNYYQRLLAI